MNLEPDPITDEAVRRALIGVNRSSFFEWLLELHDVLVTTVGPIEWKCICARAAEMGKVDGLGKPPTPQRATKTWTAVRRAKAAIAASSQAGPKTAPSHDLQPEQTRLLPQPSPDFWDDPDERTKILAPNIKEPTAVAPIPDRLVPATKEAPPIPHSKQTTPSSDDPSDGATETPD